MATSFTQNITLPNPTPADPSSSNTWGTLENTARTILDGVVAGILPFGVGGAANVVLTSTQGAVDQSKNAHFNFTGVLTGNINVLWPNGLTRVFSVINNTTGAFTLSAAVNNGGVPAGTATVVPQGSVMELVSDGTNVTQRITALTAPAISGGTINNTVIGGTTPAAATFTTITSTNGLVIPGLLWGMTLSNDSTSPNSVLDVSAGFACDSTQSTSIKLAGTFFKSTGGSWIAGAGSGGAPINGMGNGLTIAITTWYHVFAIINAGAADVYFDTSVSAANKPASTTAFRRIGSFLTDGSAHIIAFAQDGDYFRWGTIVNDIATNNPGNAPVTATLNVPTGVNVISQTMWSLENSLTSNACVLLVTDLAVSDTSPGTQISQITLTAAAATRAQDNNAELLVRTNTSGQVRYHVTLAGATVSVNAYTRGWFDYRGRNN